MAFMKPVCCLSIVLMLFSCGVPYRFATDEHRRDTSYIYSLPYAKGASHFLLQGYNSRFSHKGRMALDFKMKKGTPVLAARGGVVVRAEGRFTKGGVSKKYFGQANQVIIRHADGSFASYAHLQHNSLRVSRGDSVKEGDTLARAGSTGYSATPHLHFTAWKPTTGGRENLPTRFRTKKGALYLRPGRWYKAP